MSMVRLWQSAFTGHATQPIYPTAPLTNRVRRWLTLTPITILVILSLAIGLFSGPVLRWSTIAAQQVLDRDGYISAVNPTNEITTLGYE
jgi:formate hydrogenlyase subunit 3/multisubunit Na+/H+ antiporter MnhD subunit